MTGKMANDMHDWEKKSSRHDERQKIFFFLFFGLVYRSHASARGRFSSAWILKGLILSNVENRDYYTDRLVIDQANLVDSSLSDLITANRLTCHRFFAHVYVAFVT